MRKFMPGLLLFFCLFALEGQAAELKVGIFDLKAVAEGSEPFKVKQAEMKASFEAEGKTLEKQGAELQKKFNDFQMQQQALNPEAREDRQMELTRQKRDYDDKMNSFMRRFGAAEQRAHDEIVSIILYAATKYGEREKFSLVLEKEKSGVVWSAAVLDITKAVLAETNKVWKERPKELFGQQGR